MPDRSAARRARRRELRVRRACGDGFPAALDVPAKAQRARLEQALALGARLEPVDGIDVVELNGLRREYGVDGGPDVAAPGDDRDLSNLGVSAQRRFDFAFVFAQLRRNPWKP